MSSTSVHSDTVLLEHIPMVNGCCVAWPVGGRGLGIIMRYFMVIMLIMFKPDRPQKKRLVLFVLARADGTSRMGGRVALLQASQIRRCTSAHHNSDNTQRPG